FGDDFGAQGRYSPNCWSRKRVSSPLGAQSELHLVQLKLSTYYEMVWRSEKELAFTVGKMGSPMNWSFVLEHASNSRGLMVPRAKRAGPEETEVDSVIATSYECTAKLHKVLALVLLYSSFVLYFGNKFIRKERGY
ncbi:hypothetical protein TYRP_009088, partial [Tyrophagus putrescentiae]